MQLRLHPQLRQPPPGLGVVVTRVAKCRKPCPKRPGSGSGVLSRAGRAGTPFRARPRGRWRPMRLPFERVVYGPTETRDVRWGIGAERERGDCRAHGQRFEGVVPSGRARRWGLEGMCLKHRGWSLCDNAALRKRTWACGRLHFWNGQGMWPKRVGSLHGARLPRGYRVRPACAGPWWLLPKGCGGHERGFGAPAVWVRRRTLLHLAACVLQRMSGPPRGGNFNPGRRQQRCLRCCRRGRRGGVVGARTALWRSAGRCAAVCAG